MKKAIKYAALVGLMVTHFNLAADESKVILGIEVGTSSLDLDRELEIEIDAESLDDTGVSATYSAAYRWDNNLIVEGSLSTSGNAFFSLGLTDFYQANEGKLMVGYSFPLAKNLRFVPLVGISRWDVDIQESAFLNSGPEERADFDGADFTYKVSLEFPIRKGFTFSLSYADTNIDLGSIKMTQAGIKYEF